MKRLILVAGLMAAHAATAQDAFEPPGWAYPLMDEGRGRGPDDGTLLSVPGSDLQRTQTQIDDPFNPPDWYPDEHPPMPQVVSHGRPPNVRACGQCHMLHGMGHPESSIMAGLPVNYVIRQMQDYKSGDRTSLYRRHNSMLLSATHATDEEVRAAAEYYAGIEPVKWVTVIESETVPETYVGPGNMRHPEPEGGTESIGQRIIEVPEDSHLAERRDPHSPFIAYVPPGSIDAGLELATTGAGRTIQCYICHGDDLKGLGDVPGIAGMSPIYVARQLWDIKYGARTGTSAALMLAVVANLTHDDVIALSLTWLHWTHSSNSRCSRLQGAYQRMFQCSSMACSIPPPACFLRSSSTPAPAFMFEENLNPVRIAVSPIPDSVCRNGVQSLRPPGPVNP